jgi:hypothetical protein
MKSSTVVYADVAKIKTYVLKINSHYNTHALTYNSPRNAWNLPSITGSIPGGVAGITAIMQPVWSGKSIKVEQLSGETAKRISGQKDTFSVTIAGKEGFYFRSVVGQKGSLTDKDLTPTKLNLNGKTLTKDTYEKAIIDGLKIQKHLPIVMIKLAQELLDLSSAKNPAIPITRSIAKLMQLITASDLQKIGKNFGEVVIANWCLYNKPNAISIFFPDEENNPLADFVVNFTLASKIPPLNVSAKFEDGANASLNSIIRKDSVPPVGATPAQEKAFNAVKAVAHDAVIDGLLNAEEILKTPEYKAIKAMCPGQVPTLTSISAVVENALKNSGILLSGDDTPYITSEHHIRFKEQMKPFYSTIKWGGFPDKDSLIKIAVLGKGKYYHPVLYAFSVALAARFNTNPEFSSILNLAATSIKAEQIYLNINNATLSIKVKVFSESKFEFAAGAMTYKADNVRMKVKMLKA